MPSADDRPIRTVTVPKAGGGSRKLTLLGPGEARAYARAVARVTPAVERRLGPEVFANRAPGGSSLEPWQRARMRWRQAASRLVRCEFVSTLDVSACYDSITPEVAAASLAGAGAAGPDVAEVARLLARFRDQGVPGIPVGPDPSAILANAVLSAVDAALRTQGVRSIRWVDDLLIAGDRRSVGRAELTVERALTALGLRLNGDKHRRADGGDAWALVLGPGAGAGVASGLEILAGPCEPSTERPASIR